jgi:hypothetical protein
MEQNRTPIETLTELAADLYEIQNALPNAVAGARTAGASWTEIGRALGISKQAAQQKYGDAVRESRKARYAAAEIAGQLDALEPEPQHVPDYRPEAELLRFTKATQRFVGLAEKRGLSYQIEISPSLTNEPKHQITITVRDPKDEFHQMYWIQTASVFAWSSSRPSHALRYATGAGKHMDLPQKRASIIMDDFARNVQ